MGSKRATLKSILIWKFYLILFYHLKNLLYQLYHTILHDIAFNVGVCARYQSTPKESQLTAVKRIIRYINGTPDYGLWYSKDSNACLARYSDADWAGSVVDRKSTLGGCFYFGNNLVLWISKKLSLQQLSRNLLNLNREHS